MPRQRKPYDQLAYKRPNSRHKNRQIVLEPRSDRCGFCGAAAWPLVAGIRPAAVICEACAGAAVDLIDDMKQQEEGQP